jgi:thiol:disulfide interchange protein
MRMRIFKMLCAAVALLAVAGSALPAHADGAPKPAAEIMAAAKATSAKTHKPVLVIFHATWCGWCKKLEAVMDKPQFKKMFENNYVLVNLDVMENDPAKIKGFENPGGKELMGTLGGAQSGLPFYAFLDAKGKKLGDSNVMPKNQNIGYPGEPAEIDAFMELIKKTAPHWSAADQDAFKQYLVANKPAAAH